MTSSGQETAPFCQPPRRAGPPQDFQLPGGAWDTHAHVIDGGPGMPFVPNRGYTPPSASPDAFVSMLDAVGLSYAVAIQISVHGNDNRLIADALKRYPTRLRGVVSIAGTEAQAELEALRDLGVCGIRLNEHFAGGTGADHLQALAACCRPLGWHVDLGLAGARLRALLPELKALNIRLVIDHMGACAAGLGTGHPDFDAVLQLARLPDCWVKLSGAYRFSAAGYPYDDMGPFVRALCQAAPARTIWGADWPNVAMFDAERMPDTGGQLDALRRHIGDASQLQAVLVDNPLRLYGRPGTPVLAGAP